MLFRILTVFFLTFTLHAATIAESESNNNCSLADAITIFDTGTGTVARNNDPDDYWIFTTPSSSGTLRMYTTGYNNGTDSDGYLYSNTDCTNYLIRDYRTNADVDISYSVTKNTTYYFRMNAYNGNNNPYILNFQFTSNNHAPTITQPNNGNAYALSHPENTPLSLDIDATDSDNDTLTYSLSGTDASSFTINPSTGVISFVSTPDFEYPTDSDNNNIYLLTVTVTDSGYPAMSDTQDITITVTDVNELPIVDYRMDECSWNGTTGEIKDSSGYAHHATREGTPTTIQDRTLTGKEGDFQNSSDSMAASTPDSDDLSSHIGTSGEITVSAWVKLYSYPTTDLQGRIPIVAKGTNNQWEYALYVYSNGNAGFSVWQPSGSSYKEISGGSLALNTWYHITGVLKKGQFSRLYINGSLITESTSGFSGTTSNGTSPLYIARRGAGNHYLNAKIDEVKLWAQALNSSQVSTIYSNELAGNNYDGSPRVFSCIPSALAEYRMEEASWNGTTGEVTDAMGTYNATAASLSSVKPTTAVLSPAIPTNPGTCRYGVFNRTNKDYLALPTTFPNLGNSSSFTITGWIRTTNNTLSGQRILIDDEQNSGGFGFSLGDGGAGRIRFFSRGTPSALILDTPNVINNNTWYFVAAVADIVNKRKWIYVYDTIGTQLAAVNATWSETSFGSDNGIASIGGETNSAGENTNSFGFAGNIDEVRVYQSALNSLQLNLIRQETHPCTTVVPPEPAVSFDAWDSFRSINDRKISTKIVNKPFDLTIASLNETNTGLQNFTGTACARLIDSAGNALTDWNKLTFTAEQSKTATFTLNRAIGGSDNARVRLMWQKNAPAATACDALSDTNTTVASDRFAMRPASFSVSAPNAVAGTDFAIVFNAPNFSGTPSISYNESTPGTFSVSVAEHKTGCLLGTFTPSPTSFAFLNGTKTLTTRYSEVGVLDINITDLTKPCTSRFAQIDCNDANVSGSYNSDTDLPIGLAQTQISVIPHHFDISAILSNFAGDTFTYLSNDLDMSANLRLTATAKNAEGTTTMNYTGICYAKNTTLTLPHTSVPDPLSQILYIENLTGISGTVSKTNDIVLSFPNNIFTAGVAPLDLDFNFDRSPTKPLNPFNFSFTSARIIDTDSVSGTGTPLGSSLFVYGRVHAYDVTTNTSSAPNPVEFEAYSTVPTGFVSGMPQTVLKWYRNLNHDTSAQGNVIRGGFSAGATDAAVDASAVPQNGVQIVTVTSAEDRTVHLDISPWLWYSPKYAYDYNGACTQHPCFLYDYTDASAGIEGVNSGTFQGTDFTMEPAQNITNKGVKVFR